MLATVQNKQRSGEQNQDNFKMITEQNVITPLDVNSAFLAAISINKQLFNLLGETDLQISGMLTPINQIFDECISTGRGHELTKEKNQW